MSTPSLNQFGMLPVAGQPDLQYGGSVITCQVVSTQVDPLVPGQAVKLANVAGELPPVASLAANTEASFGVVLRNLKNINFPAQARVEIGMASTVVWMTAGAAIARGAKVEFDTLTNKVITNAGVNPVLGFALDKATANNQLVRIYILNPQVNATTIADIAGLQAALDALEEGVLTNVKQITVTATIAEINAGKDLIPAVVGKGIKVLNVYQSVTGAFATNASVDLQSATAGTKVLVTAQAGLTNGAKLFPSSANVTTGAGFGEVLEAGQALKVVNVGTAATGGTSIKYTITYAYQ